MINEIQVHGVTDIGKVRTVNEDNWGERKTANGRVVVVCDGMGGHANGAEASKLAVQSILDYCDRFQHTNPIVLLNDAIKFANTQIHGFASKNPQSKGMGTTCVVVLVTTGGKVFYGHVGDSRLYRFDGHNLSQVTKDHSLVQLLVDSGQISPEQMETHPERNKILKALGLDEWLTPDIGVEPIGNDGSELLLLCTDGLSGLVRKNEMQKIIQSAGSDFQKINLRLLEAALQAGGTDNITSVIVALPTLPKNHNLQGDQTRTSGFSFKSFLSGVLLVSAVVSAIVLWNWFGNSEKKEPEAVVITEDPKVDVPPLEAIDSCGLMLDPIDSLMDIKEWLKARTALNAIKGKPCRQSTRFAESKLLVEEEIRVLDSAFLQRRFREIRGLLNEKKVDEANALISKVKKGSMQPWATDSLRRAEERLAQIRSIQ